MSKINFVELGLGYSSFMSGLFTSGVGLALAVEGPNAFKSAVEKSPDPLSFSVGMALFLLGTLAIVSGGLQVKHSSQNS